MLKFWRSLDDSMLQSVNLIYRDVAVDITVVKTHGHKIECVDKLPGWEYYKCSECDTTFAAATKENKHYRGVYWYDDKTNDYFGYEGETCDDAIVRDIVT